MGNESIHHQGLVCVLLRQHPFRGAEYIIFLFEGATIHISPSIFASNKVFFPSSSSSEGR